ncbi:MAG: ribosomal-processing cysteine protease Prp [Syntrophomonadaceae bacterium]|nr:ribosomal-processing cysteine protease Prp [Syntrophomonadaceae bacterium]
MIQVILKLDDERIKSFSVQGHAGNLEAGENIYCAGVSAITQTALLGLIKHLSHEVIYEISDGWISCELPVGLNEWEQEKAQVILTTMEAGLLAMQEVYSEFLDVIRRS